MRLMAVTYDIQAGQDEQLIIVKLGFSDVRILSKNYIAEDPQLREACVLPGGSLFRTGTMSYLTRIPGNFEIVGGRGRKYYFTSLSGIVRCFIYISFMIITKV